MSSQTRRRAIPRVRADEESDDSPGERVEKAYQLIRDMFVFTDKRLILVNRQGLTGSKVEYQSIGFLVRLEHEQAGWTV